MKNKNSFLIFAVAILIVIIASGIVSADFWINDYTNHFIYHTTNAGVNQSDGFSRTTVGSGDTVFTLTSNGTDLWWIDTADLFVYHTTLAGTNLSGGFSWSAINPTSQNSLGMTTNGSDFWITDSNDNFVYHTNRTGGNMTDGFSTSTIGSDTAYGITTNGSDFWIIDGTDLFVYHTDKSGNNITDGFSTSAIGCGNPIGITTNGSDFWITDNGDQFLYHVNRTGGNITDGFSLSALAPSGDFAGVAMNYTMIVTEAAVPTITLLSNQNNIISVDDPQIFNSTWSGNVSFVNSTLWLWLTNGTLVAKNRTTINNNQTNMSSLSLSNIPLVDNLTWNYQVFYRNITGTFSAWGTNRTFNQSKIAENNYNFSLSTTEGSYETFKINISKNPRYDFLAVSLFYNGSYYSTSFLDAKEQIISKSITVPNVGAVSNLSVRWRFNFTDGSYVDSIMYNQTVGKFSIDDCSTNTQQLFNISLFDEDSQIFLAGGAGNTSIKVTFSILKLSDGSLITNYSNNFTYINPVRLCMKTTLSASSAYRLDGVIEYSSRERFTEYYNFQNYRLNTSNANLSINLYNLNSTLGKEFKVTYKDSNFVAVANALLQIQRKYTEEGVFKTTEIPITGAEGYTIAHLVRNDVIYNIIVMKNGEILGTFTNIIADCQLPLLTDCAINLNSYSSSVLPNSFQDYGDTSFTITYNKTTRTITSIIVIKSGVPSTVSLNVTLFDTLGNTSVCADSFYAAGGTLSCIVPAGFGNQTVIAKLYKNNVAIGQSVISLNPKPSDIYGTSLMFVAIFALATIIGIGIIGDPMIYGIIFALGSIVMVAVNLIYTPSIIGVGATILWLIAAIVLILIKGGSRQ